MDPNYNQDHMDVKVWSVEYISLKTKNKPNPDTIVNDTDFWCWPHCAEIGQFQISPEVLIKILPILKWKSQLLHRRCSNVCQSWPVCVSDQKHIQAYSMQIQ